MIKTPYARCPRCYKKPRQGKMYHPSMNMMFICVTINGKTNNNQVGWFCKHCGYMEPL